MRKAVKERKKIDTHQFNVVGKSVNKIDNLPLACGRALFTDDFKLPGMLYGKLLTSPYAHAIIKDIDITQALKVSGVECILTYKDIPRIPHTTAGQGHPEPSPYDTFTLDRKVRFVGDRVLAVAATTLEACNEALSKIKVEYEILKAVFDPFEAMNGEVIIHDEDDSIRIANPSKNIAAEFSFTHEETEFFRDAEYIIEDIYTTPKYQHSAIEPHITITYFDEYGRLIIRTATQVPFNTRRIVSMVTGIPVKNIRVIKPRIGGGFGSKQEVVLEDICAWLTIKTGKPVRMEYTRKEVFTSSRNMHGSIIKVKMGASKKTGLITDIVMDVVLNQGAYGTHSLTVMMCSGSHVLPLYNKARNIAFKGRTVYTNLPVAGAYRGYGATEGFFPMECIVEDLCEKMGVDSVEFRINNYIKKGETSPVFKAMGEGREGVEQYVESSTLEECIKTGVKEFRWYEKLRKYKHQKGRYLRGVGMACVMQGSGIAEIDMASVRIKLNDDGSYNLYTGATDLGTGADTVITQIVAETLSCKPEDIILTVSDTDLTPFDTGAYASSTTYISGMAAYKAASELKKKILEYAAKIMDENPDELYLKDGAVLAKAKKSRLELEELAHHALYQSNQLQLEATASHVSPVSPSPYAAHFAEIEVDTYTGVVRVINYLATVDCGTPINPNLATAQAEGGIINGIGFALFEEMRFDSYGRMINPSFTWYKIMSAADLPDIKVLLIPSYEPTGPFGAKSIGEININGPLPAISNAIKNALGIRLKNAPFTPEKVLLALKSK